MVQTYKSIKSIPHINERGIKSTTMIQANELRIGNYVKLNGRIMKPNAELMSLIITGETIDPMPIPLTPEILEKCGLEKTTDNPNEYFIRLNNGIDRLMVSNNSVGIIVFGSKVLTSWYNHIKSLHQLQNLYFALTGEELNVQL